MNPRQKQMKQHLFYCLMQLLLENLDELKIISQKGKELKQQLTDMCELLNNDVKDTYTIQKSTYFQSLTNKIDTVIRKNFNPEM